MLGAPIEFDDHPLVGPKAVSFDHLSSDVDEDIQLRLTDVRPSEQRRKSILERAARATSWADAEVVEGCAESGNTPVSSVFAQESPQ